MKKKSSKARSNAKYELAFYGQQCACAGRRLTDPARYYGDDWRDSDDLEVYEGTYEELAEVADTYMKNWTPHRGKVARGIREAIDWIDPAYEDEDADE